jgi:hypothetical protein
MADRIEVTGLAEFRRAVKQADADAPKQIRLVLNEAVGLIVEYARPRIPRRSGRAAAAVTARSTGKLARVQGGSRRVPYYAWLDFGGRVGPGRSVRRAFLKHGRYIYAGYFAEKPKIIAAMEAGMVRLARNLGWDVT